MHIDNKGKDILILGEGTTQGLDNTTLRADAKYPINFTQSGKRFVLPLQYNGSNRFLFVNATNFFSVDFNPIDANDILDIHKYLMKST